MFSIHISLCTYNFCTWRITTYNFFYVHKCASLIHFLIFLIQSNQTCSIYTNVVGLRTKTAITTYFCDPPDDVIILISNQILTGILILRTSSLSNFNYFLLVSVYGKIQLKCDNWGVFHSLAILYQNSNVMWKNVLLFYSLASCQLRALFKNQFLLGHQSKFLLENQKIVQFCSSTENNHIFSFLKVYVVSVSVTKFI